MTLRHGRAQRVRARRDFQRIQGSRHRVATAHFVFLMAPNPVDAAALPRLGLVVSRKVGNAVVRGRVKRLCRETFRLELGPALPRGLELVVIARPGEGAWSKDLGRAAVADEWRGALPRLLARAPAPAPDRPSEAGTSEAGGAKPSADP